MGSVDDRTVICQEEKKSKSKTDFSVRDIRGGASLIETYQNKQINGKHRANPSSVMMVVDVSQRLRERV
jgi:hypothetical protein